MAYEDRLRSAAYRSPSGATFTLQFDDVERRGSKKAAIHELPQQDAADVQDLGNTAVRFPMSVYFTGAEYDTQADAFWAALSEKGPGSLQHPRYGDIPVLPLTWAQSESWTDKVGRADFKIEFIRMQAEVVFPVTSVAAGETVSAAVAEALADTPTFDPESAADALTIAEDVGNWLEAYEEGFAAITAQSKAIQAQASAAVNGITSQIDTLIGAPTALFGSLANLLTLPARVVTGVVGKVEAYRSQIAAIAARVPETYAQAVVACQALFYAFAGMAVASTVGTLDNRGEAISAAETMSGGTDDVAQAIEAAEAAVPGFRADPTVLAALTEAMATARDAIVEQSYSLRAERRVTLATERTPYDLVAEFFGDDLTDIDAAVNELIRINALQGDAIIVVPAGREVVYYA